MRTKILQKSVGVFLTICFSMGMLAAPVSAKPQGPQNQTVQQNHQGNHNNHEKNKKFEQDEHRKNIVRKVQNCQATVLSALAMRT
ncbi:MAG: hypothetical protein AB9858_08300 [Acidaminococcaceae bacterium]